MSVSVKSLENLAALEEALEGLEGLKQKEAAAASTFATAEENLGVEAVDDGRLSADKLYEKREAANRKVGIARIEHSRATAKREAFEEEFRSAAAARFKTAFIELTGLRQQMKDAVTAGILQVIGVETPGARLNNLIGDLLIDHRPSQEISSTLSLIHRQTSGIPSALSLGAVISDLRLALTALETFTPEEA